MIKYERIDADLDLNAKVVSFKNEDTMTYYSMHFHNSAELLYCVLGSLHVRVYDQEYILQKGDMLYINSNVAHETKSTERNHVYMIQMKKPFFDSDRTFINLNTIRNDVISQGSAYKKLVQLMESISDIKQKSEPYYQFLILSQLEMIRYHLLTNFLEEKPESMRTDVDVGLKMAEIMSLINQHYMQGITVSDIAKHFDYTLPYFSALFRKHTGITCMDYIQKIRLESAMRLLRERRISVIEIAYEVGFPNVKAMRNLFKRELGITPSEYAHSITL